MPRLRTSSLWSPSRHAWSSTPLDVSRSMCTQTLRACQVYTGAPKNGRRYKRPAYSVVHDMHVAEHVDGDLRLVETGLVDLVLDKEQQRERRDHDDHVAHPRPRSVCFHVVKCTYGRFPMSIHGAVTPRRGWRARPAACRRTRTSALAPGHRR